MARNFNYDPKIVRDEVSKTLGLTTNSNKEYIMCNDHVYKRRLVHRFRMADVEDPDLYVAMPIHEWQQTEHGKWVMAHGQDPQYHMHLEPITYGHIITITAHISDKRWTEYCLRFVDNNHI